MKPSFISLSLLITVMLCWDTLAQNRGSVSGVNFDRVSSSRCGAIALFAACELLGVHSSVDEMVKLTNTDEGGTSMLHLKLAAQAKGLYILPVRTDIKGLINYLSRAKTCCIALAPKDHFVLIVSYHNGRFQIFDPPGAKVKIRAARLEKIWNGELLVLSKFPFIEKSKRLLNYIGTFGVAMLMVGILAVVVRRFKYKVDRHNIG